MKKVRRRIACPCLLTLAVFLLGASGAPAQPPLYRLGAPSPPVRDPRLTTDNGIPGTGAYYFQHYPWPSLRQSLQEYGLFGRRFRARTRAPDLQPPQPLPPR